MPRSLSDWLLAYEEYIAEMHQGSPEVYHRWVSLSILAATVGRRAVLDRGGAFRDLLNLYVVLVGRSAYLFKSTSINIGLNIYNAAFPANPVSSQLVSAAKLAAKMGEQSSIDGDGSTYVVADEFADLFPHGTNAFDLVAFLTDMYGYRQRKTWGTVSRGEVTILNPCINLLGGTTPEWLSQYVPTTVDGQSGGFLGRFVLVFASEPRCLAPFPSLSEQGKRLETLLQTDLRQIASVGTFQQPLRVTVIQESPAGEWYDAWYTRYATEHQFSPDGYHGRRPTTLLKIGALCAIARGEPGAITPVDLERADRLLAAVETFLPEAQTMLEESKQGAMARRVLSRVAGAGPIGVQHSALCRAVSHVMTSRELKEVLETLTAAGQVRRIEQPRPHGGNAVFYRGVTPEETGT